MSETAVQGNPEHAYCGCSMRIDEAGLRSPSGLGNWNSEPLIQGTVRYRRNGPHLPPPIQEAS